VCKVQPVYVPFTCTDMLANGGEVVVTGTGKPATVASTASTPCIAQADSFKQIVQPIPQLPNQWSSMLLLAHTIPAQAELAPAFLSFTTH
jgi:hypothetical protein